MWIRPLFHSLCALGALSLSTQAFSADNFSCKAELKWVNSPNAPIEIPEGKEADFCQFYQFSWQWFLQLVSPAKDSTIRQFQDQKNYPILEGVGDNSCDDKIGSNTLFTVLNKIRDGFAIPERTGQAGTFGKAIYDQAGNIVFYDVRFSRNLCNAGKIQAKPNFPAGTTEMKTAWKQLTSQDDVKRYFVMEADIDGIPGKEKLGLIGFHLAVATNLHPEMVWSSFEHIDNSAECNNAGEADQKWSFTSKACIQEPGKCTFNEAVKPAKISGEPPTEICTSHPGGMESGDPHFDKNSVAVNDLNIQINAFLSELENDNPMSVWKHYKNIGALWVSDITQPSNGPNDEPLISNQRGSLRLANTVMETTFQDGFVNKQGVNQGPFSSNCFGCHNYTVDPNYRNTGPHNNFDLSHIFINDILGGQCKTPTDVNAGPIFSDKEAQSICAATCENKGGWNGNWKTTTPGTQSVCACCNAK